MGRARGGFAAYAAAAGVDEERADKVATTAGRNGGAAKVAAAPAAPTGEKKRSEVNCCFGDYCERAVPAGSYGSYEVAIDRMLVRAAPSRQAPLLAGTKSGARVRGAPYDVDGDIWLHLDEASSQDVAVRVCGAWMLIVGEGLGQLMTELPAPRLQLSSARNALEEDSRGKPGQASLLAAVRSGDAAEVVRLLVAKEAEANTTDDLGETPLFEAALLGQSGPVATLLLAGCDASRRSAEGKAAADLAAQPLLATCLRAFAGDELERANFCTSQVFQQVFGTPAYEGLVRRLARLSGQLPRYDRPAFSKPADAGDAGARSPDKLSAQQVRSLEAWMARQEGDGVKEQEHRDFDWGRLLWDWRLERSRFRVLPELGAKAVSSVPESVGSKLRLLKQGEVVHLLLSLRSFVDEDGRWVCVTVAADEDPLAKSSLASSNAAWWVRWTDLELVPSPVRMQPNAEQAEAERALQRADHRDGKSLQEALTAYQIQCRASRAEDERNLARYQARISLIAGRRYTAATIDERGEFVQGRATTGVADLAESEKRKREDRLREAQKKELETKRRLARLRGKPADVDEPDDSDDASSMTAPEATVAAGVGAPGVGGGDWSKMPTARAVCPDAVKGRVSVVCPTDHRRHYLHESLYRCYCMQEWPDKELIVLDTGGQPSPFFSRRPPKGGTAGRQRGPLDGEAERSQREERPQPSAAHPSPLDDPSVRYVHVRDYSLTLGDKRNQMLQLASGEFVANFDDDNIYAPDYLTLMVEQLRASGAQVARLGSCFAWDPFSDRLSWHDEMRGRGETFVHFKGPTRVLRYDSKDVGEEESFTAACVAHDVDDVFGVFAHVHHGDNASSLVQRHAKAPSGVPVSLLELPSRRLKATLPQRRKAFMDKFGRAGPPKRFHHLAEINQAKKEADGEAPASRRY